MYIIILLCNGEDLVSFTLLSWPHDWAVIPIINVFTNLQGNFFNITFASVSLYACIVVK